jgi:hypothetical protein
MVKYAILQFGGAYVFRDSLFIGNRVGIRDHDYVIPSTAVGATVTVSAYAIDYQDNAIDSLLATLPFRSSP